MVSFWNNNINQRFRESDEDKAMIFVDRFVKIFNEQNDEKPTYCQTTYDYVTNFVKNKEYEKNKDTSFKKFSIKEIRVCPL